MSFTGAASAVERVKVVIADGDPLARRVVRDQLQAEAGIVVVAEARDGVEAVELTCHYRPDVVLMELSLERIDGLTAMSGIRRKAPEVRIVLFATIDDHELELRALRAGAAGILSKDIDLASVGRALRAVARGEAAISRRTTMRVIEVLRGLPRERGIRPVQSALTSREWEVLDLLIAGDTVDEVAASLVLTADTICSHLKSIMRKLGAHSRAEAIATGSRLQQAAFTP